MHMLSSLFYFNPLTPNDLERSRTVSPLKIKIPRKNMREKPTNNTITHSVYEKRMVAPTCFGITLPSSGSFLSATHHVTKHNTPIHNILSTAPQLSISQKALGTLPEDDVGATIRN
jgi:hypothetical protein